MDLIKNKIKLCWRKFFDEYFLEKREVGGCKEEESAE